MNYLMAFLVGGTICLIAQLLMDVCRLLPVQVTVLFVSLGSFLEAFNLYDKLIEIGHAGALVQISNFGHALTHAAVEGSAKDGVLGILTGMFNLTSSGLSGAILSAFIVALIFKPKG